MKSNIQLTKECKGLVKNYISHHFSAPHTTLMSGWFVIMENNLGVNART